MSQRCDADGLLRGLWWFAAEVVICSCVVDCGLWIVDCGLWIVDCGLWIVDCVWWPCIEVTAGVFDDPPTCLLARVLCSFASFDIDNVGGRRRELSVTV